MVDVTRGVSVTKGVGLKGEGEGVCHIARRFAVEFAGYRRNASARSGVVFKSYHTTCIE